jgi:DNA-binding NtrC family response regulator
VFPASLSYLVVNEAVSKSRTKTIETIAAETKDVLTHYAWPGNVRELQNLIERAVILSSNQCYRSRSENLNMRTIPVEGGVATRNSGRSRTSAFSWLL